jgi:phosphoglycerol transferase
MFGTIGGFGSVFSMVITSSVRGWNRISVFIGFGSLFGIFIILQDLLNKRFSWLNFVFISGSIALLFLVGGLYDQTASASKSGNEQIKKNFHIDKSFIQSIEKSLSPGSAVYQLPYMPFPEVAPLHRLHTYDLSVGFLHSSSLRWSYAGMKGRSGDLFYRSLAKESLEKQYEVIKRLGFSGIYIDKRGFADNGQAVIEGLTSLLGAPPALMRADGEVAFFRLEPGPSLNLEGLSAEQLMEEAGYIVDHLGTRYDATLSEGFDFTRRDFPAFVKDVQGLSGPEPWGRWSDARLSPTVRIDFFDHLPDHFDLVFSCQAFGPNTDQDLKIRTGSQTHIVRMKSGVSEYRKAIDLGGEKVTSIELVPPQPVAPQQLGISADSRKLGVGLVSLQIH